MTALRQRMIAAMQMHGFSARTHQSYLAAVRDLAKFTHRAPDPLAPGDVQRYFEHLVRERGLAPASADCCALNPRRALSRHGLASALALRSEID